MTMKAFLIPLNRYMKLTLFSFVLYLSDNPDSL